MRSPKMYTLNHILDALTAHDLFMLQVVHIVVDDHVLRQVLVH